MALNITITDAGRAEVINAENTGTAPVTLAEVGFGTGQYTPTPSQTALQAEIKRVSTISGQAVADDVIHVSARDDSSDAYEVYEIGIYLQSGTLFAVYSQVGSPIIDKAAASVALLAVDITLQALNAGSITFGSTDFANPPASTTVQGVIELATDAETQTGTDNQRAVTPAGLSSRTATETRTGLVEKASNAEALVGTADKFPDAAGVHAAFKQFGLGTDGTGVISDANTAITVGFFSTNSSTQNLPFSNGNQFGMLIVTTYNSLNTYQIWFPSFVNGNYPAMYIRRKDGGNWKTWTELHTSINGASQSEALAGADNTKWMSALRVAEAFGQYGLGAVKSIADANAVLTSGFYSMPVALGAANSPIAGQSGALLVISGGADTNYVTQMWSHSNDTDSQRTFIRHKKGTGAWSPWVELQHSANGATDAETQAGTNTTKWISPAALQSRTATETRTGLAALATSAEVQTGTETNRVVTPAGLSSRTATAARTGLVELATSAEAAAGVDSLTPPIVVQPAGVHAAFNQYGLGAGVPSLSAQNLNIDRATGFYYMVSPTNGPGGNGWLVHEKLSTTYATQTFTTVTGEKYFRSNNNGSWTGWSQVTGNQLKTIWTGASSTGVSIDSLPGGYPGDGDYIIDISGDIVLLHLRQGLACRNIYGSAFAAGELVVNTVYTNTFNDVKAFSRSASNTLVDLTITGIFKVV